MTVSETRARIVRATRELHEEVGPAATTITAIAQRAGVQRLTVYRHFPDDSDLVGACAADWRKDHPLPDPISWTGSRDPVERLRGALEELYGYFAGGAPMLEQVLRDEGEMPELEDVMTPWWEYMHEVAGGLSAGWGVDPHEQRLLRAAVGHALRFETWRSLDDEGLDRAEAVELMVSLVAGVSGARPGSTDDEGGAVTP